MRYDRSIVRGLLDTVELPTKPVQRCAGFVLCTLCDLLNAADLHLVVAQRASADLVMPSKLNSILTVGRLTVATAESGTALYSTLVDHDCGVVDEHDNAAALAAAIKALADAPEQRTHMGVNTRRYDEQHLGRDVVLERFEAQLAELVRLR